MPSNEQKEIDELNNYWLENWEERKDYPLCDIDVFRNTKEFGGEGLDGENLNKKEIEAN